MIGLWVAAAAQEPAVDRDSIDVVELPSDPPIWPVVGGRPVREGKWDDAVGIVFFSAYVGCTGTLIGPRTVLTAGHCVLGTSVSHVLVGSVDWFDASQGEFIGVDEVFEYPNSQASYDVALLTLTEASTFAPRALAVDCIVRDYLDDGAQVQTVGWGGTNASGVDYANHELNEAATTVLDKNCSEDAIDNVITGCNPSVRPAGELVAGEFGEVSVCYGDSGGPLYLKTEEGDFVTGVASRLIFGPDFYTAPCSNGGVWVRTDAILDWIIDTVGVNKITLPVCNDAPVVTAPELITRKNRSGDAVLEIDDPDGDGAQATVAIATEPAHGTASVDGRTVTYRPDRGFVGEDVLTLAVTDVGADWNYTGDPVTIEVDLPITVENAFLGIGCASTPAASATALLLAALGVRRARSARPAGSRRP